MILAADELILDAYHRALSLKLDEEFILLLYEEINKRNLKVTS